MLFLIYITHITDFVTERALNLYADDTAIIAVEPDHRTLASKLQSYAAYLERWCIQNKLNINIKKSKVMHFNIGKKKSDEKLDVKIMIM